MMPVAFPNWGERSWLYDKSLQYVMSLDLLYALPIQPDAVAGTSTRLPMLGVPPARGQVTTYRTVGPLLFRGIDNIEREVPEARLVRGNDSLLLQEEGAVTLEGRLLLEADTTEPILLGYSGALDLDGGTLSLAQLREFSSLEGRPKQREINGTAFIATRQEVSVPKYRWLTYNQFVGVGRATALFAEPPANKPGQAAAFAPTWLLRMTFDLYLGL